MAAADRVETRNRSRKPKPMQNGAPDDFQTPPWALDPLWPHLRPGWRIWECAAGRGNLVRAFEAHGFPCVGSDILTGQDFLAWQPDVWDCIVTNPPFSAKEEFLARCYALGKPFALLMPLTTFEGQKRQAMFREHGVEVVFMPKRINFETPRFTEGRPSSAWFATAWFTHGLGIGKALTFWKPDGGQAALALDWSPPLPPGPPAGEPEAGSEEEPADLSTCDWCHEEFETADGALVGYRAHGPKAEQSDGLLCCPDCCEMDPPPVAPPRPPEPMAAKRGRRKAAVAQESTHA